MSEDNQEGWMYLAELVNARGGIDKSEAIQSFVLDGLQQKRIRYRYRSCLPAADEHGKPIPTPWRDDLPEHFWHSAQVDWIFSVARFESSTSPTRSLIIGFIQVLLPDGPLPAAPRAHAQPLSASAWITKEVARLIASPDRPSTITQASRLLEAEMERAVKASECKKPLTARTIEQHYLRATGLWNERTKLRTNVR
jgi:hypothetical protein